MSVAKMRGSVGGTNSTISSGASREPEDHAGTASSRSDNSLVILWLAAGRPQVFSWGFPGTRSLLVAVLPMSRTRYAERLVKALT